MEDFRMQPISPETFKSLSDEQRYRYADQGLLKIVKCCKYGLGFYCGFFNNKGSLFSSYFFCRSDIVKRVSKELGRINANFGVSAERQLTAGVIDQLRPLESPFAFMQRWDDHLSYLCTSDIEEILTELENAAAFKDDRETAKEVNEGTDSKKKDNSKEGESGRSKLFSDNQKKFASNLMKFRNVIKEGTYTYNRHRFEDEAMVKWCNGVPKCPEPYIENPCGDDDDNGGSCPIPKPKVFKLVQLIDLIKLNDPKGVEWKKWAYQQEDEMTPDFSQFLAMTYIGQLAPSKDINPCGFIYALRSKSNEKEQRIYQFSFNLIKAELIYRGYKAQEE